MSFIVVFIANEFRSNSCGEQFSKEVISGMANERQARGVIKRQKHSS